ncbi:MAG: ORF6N domain-containing protein [Bacteroidota bacterium]
MSIIPTINEKHIVSKIYTIRGQKVMLDRDLAEMYGVETRVFNQSIKRNIERFPKDFMFQLNKEEFENLISQIVTSSWGGTRKMPYAFTEQGVAMLSSVLNSSTAIQVNIQIIRTFTRMRQLLINHQDIMIKLSKIEKQVLKLDRRTELNEKDIEDVFDAINQLIAKEEEPSAPRNKIGFKK